MDFIKKFMQVTAVMLLIGFVLGLEHNNSWLHWLGSLAITAGFLIAVFWEEIKNPNWRQRQYLHLKGYLNW